MSDAQLLTVAACVRVSLRYAVHVTGLPYNATKDEVLAHFNNL